MNDPAKPPTELLAILHAAHAAEGQLELRLGAVGLSLAKLQALRVLAEAGESLPLGQLADRLACVKSNITQLVDRLEADGLVVRQPDPHDRRTKLAALTPNGRRACEDGARVQDAAEREMLQRLTTVEAQQLASLVTKLGPPGG